MKKTILSILTLLLISTLDICSQVTQQWVKRYPFVQNLQGSAVATVMDAQGNLYVIGSAEDEAAQYIDYTITIKYDCFGNMLWSKRFYGFNTTRPRNIAIDAQCNVYITGGANRYLYGQKDFFTIKYTSTGQEEWIRYYAGVANSTDEASHIVIDENNNIYVAGESANYSAAVVKYAPSGNVLWEKSFAESSLISLVGGLHVDSENNLVITGLKGDVVSAALKLNPNGDILWSNLFTNYYNAGSGNNASILDENDNIYLFGNSEVNSDRHFCFTVKYTPGGSIEWYRVYQASQLNHTQSIGASIASNRSGGVYVAGFCGGTMGMGAVDFFVVNYSNLGDSIWVKKYSNGAINYLRGMNSDASGNVYVAGMLTLPGGASWGTVKFNSSGTFQWMASYPGEESCTHVQINEQGDVYVTGTNFLGIGTSDITTIKYSPQFTGIQPVSNEIPNQYSLSQNYPNPFNPATNIKFQIPKAGFVNLIVYDALGREVSTLVNEQLNPGTYGIDWNASNYPSGVYYYKLIAGRFSETKKMILMK